MHADIYMTGGHPMLLDERIFKQTVMRERKRANRSGLAMALLLINLPNRRGEQGSVDVAVLTNTLSAIISELDILGWFKPPCVIGLIVPEIDPADLARTCDRLETIVRNEVSIRVDEEIAQDLSFRWRVYPEPSTLIARDEQMSTMDSLFYPEFSGLQSAVPRFHFLKRGMDVVFSALLLVLLLPAFALIAAIVKLSSPGPVLFRQMRIGHLMKPFTMCKFRTMHATSDQQVHQNYVSWFITASDQAQSQQKPAVFKLTNDIRITPIGRFLRRTSLDELPQLWNVLIGDMSLVGPRPPLPYELQQYKPWHRGRVLEAKPGMTGLWQVVGRSRTTFDEMVRLDLRYARTMSLWSDIKILLATPAAMITGKGAC
jgi:lipopolysaccharide/colanic/teichoic acid biosynthesis glycosyltransferase